MCSRFRLKGSCSHLFRAYNIHTCMYGTYVLAQYGYVPVQCKHDQVLLAVSGTGHPEKIFLYQYKRALLASLEKMLVWQMTAATCWEMGAPPTPASGQ